MTPFKGTNRVTSGYRLQGRPDHNGIDVTNPYGSWRVREVTGGTATKTYTTAARGLVLEVTTAAGDIERYQHLLEVLAVIGQKVPQGAEIAIAGNTGECYGTARADNEYMAGRHLHFEVLKGGKTIVNPSAWLGLPNALADYPGNDDLDNPEDAPTPPEPPVITPVAATDISHHQGAVDFEKMKSQGVTAVIVRVSNGLKEDTRCREYAKAAKQAGLTVYAYYYSVAHYNTVAGSSLDAGKAYGEKEVDFAVNILGELDLQYCSLDMELADPGYTTLLSSTQLTELANHIMARFEAKGIKTSLYANASWIFDRMGLRPGALTHPLWVAYWVDAEKTHSGHVGRVGALPAGKYGEYMAEALGLGKLWAWQWGGGTPAGMGKTYGASSSGIDRDWLYGENPEDAANPMYMLTIGPASGGDKNSGVAWAKSLGLPVEVTEV